MVDKAHGVNRASGNGYTKKTHASSKNEQINCVHDEARQKPIKTEPEQSQAEKNFKNDLKSGKLKEKKGKLWGMIPYDNYVYTPNIDKKTGKRETLGDIRTRYNLPEGYLRHYVTSGGGNFDLYEAPEEVVIDAETLRASVLATH